MKKQKQQYVMVTTEHRGVFAGFLASKPGATVTLKDARNCVYWSADVKGFLGLASSGPTNDCKIGPAVLSLTLYKVTSIVEVTPEAQAKWEKSPWTL